MDANYEMWIKALRQEKMSWKQLIVDSTLIEKVNNHYSFIEIPLTIFTDNKGFEIARFSGFEPGEKDKYTELIKKLLNVE